MNDVNSEDDAAVMLNCWIAEQLAGAGFSDDAVVVAIEESLDWRMMVRLREEGCATELALEIVR